MKKCMSFFLSLMLLFSCLLPCISPEAAAFTIPDPIAPDLITGPITWTDSAANPKATDAYVYIKANAAYSGRFDEVGIEIYDASGNLIVHKDEATSASNYVEIWYNITEETGVVLRPNTTYYYQIYARFDGVAYWTDKMSFTTTMPESIAPDLITGPITWTGSVADPKATDAYVYIKANAAYSGRFDQAGITVYDSNGNEVAKKTEQANASNYLEIWYNITEETGAVLMPGKTYSYQFYVRFDSTVYYSDKMSFTTTMPDPVLPDLVPGPIVWSNSSADITDSYIKLHIQVNSSSKGLFGQHGIVIKDASGKEVYYSTTENPHVGSEQIFENYIARCSDAVIKPNSEYSYYYFVNFDGTVYSSDVFSFTSADTIPHSYAWTVTREATCYDEGIETGTCTRCNHTQTRTVPKLTHSFQQFRVDPPSCKDPIEIVHTCSHCGYSETTYMEASCPSAHFSDVPAVTNWAHDGVDFAVSRGLFNGVSDTKFDPSGDTTRAMLVTVLWRYAGQPSEGSNTFIDVAAGKWYEDAIAWANSTGVVNGVGGGKFDPNGCITRQQMAAILFRYSTSLGIDTSARASLTGFPDHAEVSGYAVEAMQWAVAEGLINGSGGNLLPKGNATRAQVATILMRYIDSIME